MKYLILLLLLTFNLQAQCLVDLNRQYEAIHCTKDSTSNQIYYYDIYRNVGDRWIKIPEYVNCNGLYRLTKKSIVRDDIYVSSYYYYAPVDDVSKLQSFTSIDSTYVDILYTFKSGKYRSIVLFAEKVKKKRKIHIIRERSITTYPTWIDSNVHIIKEYPHESESNSNN